MLIYWYELVYRGISPGAFPKGAIASEHEHVNHKGHRYGAVAYNDELSKEDIANYELAAIAAPRELYDFEEWDAKRVG